MNTDGTVGGGEILKYWNQNSTNGTSKLDTALIRQFMLLPVVRAIIIILSIIIAALVIVKIFEIRSPFKGRAITNELEHLDKVKKHDEAIVRANKMMQTCTLLIERSPLALNKSYVDYWTYNLSRANVRIPGGFRVMRPEEFNAIISVVEIFIIALSLVTSIFISAPLGMVTIIFTLVMASTLPMMFVRQTVRVKDEEIVANFADFYLMIHYVLLASAGTPVAGIMKSYDKTTSSEEMHRFIDVCLHYIETYGEYEGTRYIAKQYREIPEVGKLMRLIRQANEGGDVRAELIGFRNELIAAKKYALTKRMDRLVMKAKMSFNILMPVLIQAIISAMAIYLDDLSVASSFL
jgi:hypothetical protein